MSEGIFSGARDVSGHFHKPHIPAVFLVCSRALLQLCLTFPLSPWLQGEGDPAHGHHPERQPGAHGERHPQHRRRALVLRLGPGAGLSRPPPQPRRAGLQPLSLGTGAAPRGWHCARTLPVGSGSSLDPSQPATWNACLLPSSIATSPSRGLRDLAPPRSLLSAALRISHSKLLPGLSSRIFGF